MLEGGSIIDGAMVDAKLVDRFCFFYCTENNRREGCKAPDWGIGVKLMNEAILLKNMMMEKVGVDYLISGEPEY